MSIALVLADGKRVGHIEGRRAILPVTSRNFYYKHGGYSVDEHVVNQIGDAGCDTIVFRDRKTGRDRWISFADFCANAQLSDFGFGVKATAPESLYHPRRESQAPAQPQQLGFGFGHAAA